MMRLNNSLLCLQVCSCPLRAIKSSLLHTTRLSSLVFVTFLNHIFLQKAWYCIYCCRERSSRLLSGTKDWDNLMATLLVCLVIRILFTWRKKPNTFSSFLLSSLIRYKLLLGLLSKYLSRKRSKSSSAIVFNYFVYSWLWSLHQVLSWYFLRLQLIHIELVKTWVFTLFLFDENILLWIQDYFVVRNSALIYFPSGEVLYSINWSVFRCQRMITSSLRWSNVTLTLIFIWVQIATSWPVMPRL
jgi:hypothetical protein